MKQIKMVEWGAFLALFSLLTFAGIYLLPDPSFRNLHEPPYAGSAAAFLVAIVLVILRLKVPRNTRLEKRVLALFIAGMPMIYLWSALLASDKNGVFVESVGVVIFGGLALLGYFRSPRFLVLGIAAHALAWDVWHHNDSAYMANWYAVACFIVDLGFAFLVLTQLPEYMRAQPHDTPKSRDSASIRASGL